MGGWMGKDNNEELSREATGILRVFGYQELIDFWKITHTLMELWDWHEVDEEEVRKQIESEPHELILIQTARVISQMENRFYKAFKKIRVKFGAFDAKCAKIEKELESVKQLREKSYYESVQHTILAEEAQNQLRGSEKEV